MEDCNRRASVSSGNDLLDLDKNRLKLLFGQFLFVITFVLNSATLIGVLWAILKFGLSQDLSSSILLKENHSGSKFLEFKENILVETLGVKSGESLKTNRIFDENIYITTDHRRYAPTRTKSKNYEQEIASILINPNEISMQAESFSSVDDGQYQFVLPKRLDSLEISNSLHNIKSIRPMPSHSARVEQNLNINSREALELSGNRGVNVHSSKVLELKSELDMDIESKEDSIIMQLNGGNLLLPSLQLFNVDTSVRQQHYSEHYYAESKLQSIIGQGEKVGQLCIDKTNGLLYQSASNFAC